MKPQLQELAHRERWCGRRWPATLVAALVTGLAMPVVALVLLATPLQAQPTITAGSNPVMVPNGQASGSTNITWKAAPDYTYCEIYLSVDNGPWSEFARGGDSNKPTTIKIGSSHTFRMMVYEGQAGTPKINATLTVTTAQGNPPSPTPGGGGGIGNVVLSDTVKEKNTIPISLFVINNVRVTPGSDYIMIQFNGPRDQVPYVAIGRAAPIKKDSEWVFGDNLVGGGFALLATVSEKAKGEYTFWSAFGTTFSEDGLAPGRTYHYIISIPVGAGRHPYQDTDSFTTLREATGNASTQFKQTRLRLNEESRESHQNKNLRVVVWERVLIEDDSDDLSTGQADFWFWADYGQPGGKTFQYGNGNIDSGHSYDLNRTLVVNNASNLLTLSASGDEFDCSFHAELSEAEPPIGGPSNSECDDKNVAKGEFDLTQYAENTKVPFRLNSMPGSSLKFVIFGHFEIARASVLKPPVKAIGRVKAPPTSDATPGPPKTICDVAREARERNSPAAPGLEERCRADLAAKGAAIAEQDPIVAEARAAETNALYQQGFDIATGIFGDPAQGALGNTATGSGSLRIRDSLSAAGQRGFNASVKLHLSRNYKP